MGSDNWSFDQSHEMPAPKDDASTAGSGVGTAIITNHTADFTTTLIFYGRQSLIQWTQEVGRQNGSVIVVKNSQAGALGRKPRLTLACERSGEYRDSKQWRKNPENAQAKRRKTCGTKKCGCLFQLQGVKLASNDEWMVRVECGVHNHPPALHLEGHSYAGRLSEEEQQVLVDMSKSLVKPREILYTLKQRNGLNVSTMRHVYNARRKHRVLDRAGRSEMQQLLGQLHAYGYTEWHTSDDDTSVVRSIFWAHPHSIELLRAFPEVLIMDCTYKTNKYRLPLLQIVGVTSTGLTFAGAFAYLESEKEGTFAWAMDKLKTMLEGCMLPRVIVTDRDLGLMNAVRTVFPMTNNMLCRWHINKNIAANCKKLFETSVKWKSFLVSWELIVWSPTENEFFQNVEALERSFCGYRVAVDYVKDSWLVKYKELFVTAWTRHYMHFDNETTNRVESAHAKLKRYLGTSNCSFVSSWATINALLELQRTEVLASFEKSKYIAQHNFKPAVFREMRGLISRDTLTIVHTESVRADSIGPDDVACGCQVRRTHGLPCAHEIAEYKREGRAIPLSCIYRHWRKLDLLPTTPKEEPSLSCKGSLERIDKRFATLDNGGKIHLLRKLMELEEPQCTPLIEPEVKTRTRGRLSAKATKLLKSTRRDPSAFEYAPSFNDSNGSNSQSVNNTACPVGLSAAVMSKTKAKPESKPKGRVIRTRGCVASTSFRNDYLSQFPEGLRPYIMHVKDVKHDGNCGFRAIAGLLGYGEDNWVQIRKELGCELMAFRKEYCDVYHEGEMRVAELATRLAYYGDFPPTDGWMTIPDMGPLIASRYDVVLLHISARQCLTFLPLRSPPHPTLMRKIIVVGFVNGGHFVMLYMQPGCPMPPIASSWKKNRRDSAVGWDTYEKNIKHFLDIMGPGVATRESIEIDGDVSEM